MVVVVFKIVDFCLMVKDFFFLFFVVLTLRIKFFIGLLEVFNNMVVVVFKIVDFCLMVLNFFFLFSIVFFQPISLFLVFVIDDFDVLF